MEYGKIICHLKTILKERGISKEEICKDLHISGQEMEVYCNDQVYQLDADLISRLCFYLHISFEELFSYQKTDR